MPFSVTMPKLTPTMEEGAIAKWSKKEGDFVEAGETLLEIATDKATVEHAALDEGYLRKILVPEGDEAQVNQPIAIFTLDKDESIEGFEVEKPPEAPVEEEAAEEVAVEAKPKAAAAGLSFPGIAPVPPMKEVEFVEPSSTVKASPLARKLAKERGLDLSTVAGSGPGGRVVERDLDKAQPASLVTFGRHEEPSLPSGTYDEEKLTPMRRVIGERLQQSKTFIPHFYVTQEVDAEPLVAIRDQLKSYGVRVSFNDLITRATALALREKPALNSGFNSVDNTIIRFKTIDIAIAVSMEAGLITPVVRYADYKNVGQIGAEVRDLAKRARQGKLQPEEYLGGSFTISNLGMTGISDFVGVINPPQSSILAVGSIRDVPVVRNGTVVPGKTLALTVSCDHRVVDGLGAAEFLTALRNILENPSGLILS